MFKPTSAKRTGESSVEILYTLMVTPALPQPRVYDHCGQTHDLIFDLSIPATNELIVDLLEVVPADGIEGIPSECPPLRALRSEVDRGFVCQEGEVLNNIRSSDVPRLVGSALRGY